MSPPNRALSFLVFFAIPTSILACAYQEPGTSMTLLHKGPRPLDPNSEKGIKMKNACDKCHALYPTCHIGPCVQDFNTCLFHEGDVEGYCKL